jgi:hypothetical protein
MPVFTNSVIAGLTYLPHRFPSQKYHLFTHSVIAGLTRNLLIVFGD